MGADRRTHLVTVFGPPGIGKSRLVRELQPRLELEGVFLKGRCRPYGETTGYGAFGQQVSQIAGIFETDTTGVARAKLRERVAALLPEAEAKEVGAHLAILLGLSNEGAPDKQLLFYSARRFVEAVARTRATAFVFEDIHWAEPALLELLGSWSARTASSLLDSVAWSSVSRMPAWAATISASAQKLIPSPYGRQRPVRHVTRSGRSAM